MAAEFHNFIHLVFISAVALFPVVNPVGSAFVVLPYLSRLDDAGKKRAVRLITLYAFCICTVTLLVGQWILKLFGLSIPVVQLAGGIMICRSGWEMLGSGSGSSSSTKAGGGGEVLAAQHRDLDDQLFFPLTFPLTTGAGTVSVLLTLSAHGADTDLAIQALHMGAIMVAVVVMCALVYVFYLNTQRIRNYIGSRGDAIVNRLIAFFIFCVGLQIATTGAKTLFQ
ncbi:MarC family protein [Variovorax sp. OV329]|uniref:MarC family protein n=1 Tax=Variovorax sp. OV329 TaxID=1882825 RepID=UPI0008F1AE1E|nr:MarC family protein [Variovorax sp. OV329]SFN46748.1 multiple antibiotic resistance protein [Variovorax sp. OV329]